MAKCAVALLAQVVQGMLNYHFCTIMLFSYLLAKSKGNFLEITELFQMSWLLMWKSDGKEGKAIWYRASRLHLLSCCFSFFLSLCDMFSVYSGNDRAVLSSPLSTWKNFFIFLKTKACILLALVNTDLPLKWNRVAVLSLKLHFDF